MKKILLMILPVVMGLTAGAQTVSDFENLNLPADSFWNGSDLSAGFTSGNAFFTNSYDTAWGSWTGFAYSSMGDTLTPGFANMYSAVTGGGYNGSNTFAVANPSSFGPAWIGLRGAAKGKMVSGFFITNTTYAYLSMRDGDSYAKKFGGASGNDPDWFRLKISGYLNGALTDTAEFYLADYRFADSTQDYIVRNWQWVDLTALGAVDSLVFSLSSSDVGSWGMNTPAFFCMDNFTTTDGVGFAGITAPDNAIAVYPNPVDNQLNISSETVIKQCRIYSCDGKMVLTADVDAHHWSLDVSSLQAGVYFVQLTDGRAVWTRRLVKR